MERCVKWYSGSLAMYRVSVIKEVASCSAGLRGLSVFWFFILIDNFLLLFWTR